MKEDLWIWFKGLPPPLAVLLMATLPIFELHGAIPLGYILDAGSPFLIYLLAVIGNFLPVLPILLLLAPAERHLRRFGWLNRFFDWWFRMAMKRSKLVQRYQAIGLTLLLRIRADDSIAVNLIEFGHLKFGRAIVDLIISTGKLLFKYQLTHVSISLSACLIIF